MITNLKRLYISLITLTLVFMIFGTVTYAWISMASVNTLDGMSLTATSGNELLISIDGIHYDRDLPSIVLDELLNDVHLTDVTSTDGITFHRGGLNPNEDAVSNRDYVSFELWLQTDQPEHAVFLVDNVNQYVSFDTTMSGTYVVSQGVTWKADYTFANGPLLSDVVKKNDEYTYFASNAIRISIIEIKDINNSLDTRESSELRNFIYDPSENEQRGYGVSFGAFSYFLASSQLDISLPDTLQNVSYHLSTFDPADPFQSIDDESMIAILQPTNVLSPDGKIYYRGKIVINVWIEGWDADAFNSILNDQIKIQLKFKAGKSSL